MMVNSVTTLNTLVLLTANSSGITTVLPSNSITTSQQSTRATIFALSFMSFHIYDSNLQHQISKLLEVLI